MLRTYTTCPSSAGRLAGEFRRDMLDVAAWTESAGFRGLLVYTDNTLVDPWLAAQTMIANTERLVPLVAVQPVYMHPYSVARMISSIGFLTGRRVDLNLVTGGFAGHLRALGDELGHDDRYRRLVRYGSLVRRLLTERTPVSDDDAYYRLRAAVVEPGLDPQLVPTMFVSGSSAVCRRASRDLGVSRLCYPQPLREYTPGGPAIADGIRLGIIARDRSEVAWQVAHQRFPGDPRGERLHAVAARVAESHWHRELSAQALTADGPDGVYWLHPFRTYKTFCPYLVGSYTEVAELLARYLTLGVTTLILDVPTEADDLHHATVCVRAADRLMQQWTIEGSRRA